MTYQIPDKFMGIPVKGAMERVLEKNSNTPEIKSPDIKPSLITNINNPEDYILLSGKNYGTYSYPDLLVSRYRLSMSPEVEQVASRFGYSVSNSAKENNGRDFIGNINWKQALSLNLGLGGKTLNPRQFADFLLLLKSGNAVDGTGRKIQKSKLDEILDEIITVRDPWRAEWLDADFRYIGSGKLKNLNKKRLWIYSEHKIDVSGNLVADYKKELENCLMVKGDKINLETMNSQGMPVEKGNDFCYWCPDEDNNSFARFSASSGGAFFDCLRVAGYSDSSLGVRHVREARAQKN